MNLIREIADWIRFAFRVPTEEKAIVFYSEQASYWAYFEGLVEALVDAGAGPLCYVTSDPKDPILEREDPAIHAFYLRSLLPLFMLFVKCRVFVMTLTELNQRHVMRSINPVHYAYVFHSLNSTHMAYTHGAFDHYDSVLCCGSYMIDEIRKEEALRELPRKELVEAGYYRLERIHQAWTSMPAPSGANDAPKGNVLLAPSWSAHNVLVDHGETLVARLAASGYAVTLRPHPETLKRDPELVEAFAARFADEPLVTLERSVATDHSLLTSDVLITDWSGIAQEFALGTERPVLYLDVPRKVHNERYEELEIEPFEARIRSEIGHVLSPEDIPVIHETVDRLMMDKLKYRDRIVELRDESIFEFGRSSEIGARHLMDVLERPVTSQQGAD
ncbi:MAG: CDP-glycerol glycerophosphotransferase family protein [Myxococcota bacterium]